MRACVHSPAREAHRPVWGGLLEDVDDALHHREKFVVGLMWSVVLDGAGYDRNSDEHDCMVSTRMVHGGDRQEWATYRNLSIDVFELVEQLPHFSGD